MEQVTVHILRAFCDGTQGGNPAGVVLEGDNFDQVTKQQIASVVGLSETAFVCRSKVAAVRLEFFTPTRPIDHCGHATIASFSLLRLRRVMIEDSSSNETVDGIREIQYRGEQTLLEQSAPRFQEIGNSLRDRALKALGLSASHLIAPAMVGSTGGAFLLIPVRDSGLVKGATPWFDQIQHLSDELKIVGFYLFSPHAEVSGRDAGARMFAPRYGIREEAATGMAAGPAAAFLHTFLGVHKELIKIEQGRLMNPASPSLISVVLEKDGNAIAKVRVGGSAMIVGQKTLQFE